MTPVTVVDNVIAGVVVAVATVPAKPLAKTTEALVTVPAAKLYGLQVTVGVATVILSMRQLVIAPP
jgi:hypothetical protein